MRAHSLEAQEEKGTEGDGLGSSGLGPLLKPDFNNKRKKKETSSVFGPTFSESDPLVGSSPSSILLQRNNEREREIQKRVKLEREN